MKSNIIYQASTLQTLALGYTKPVVTVRDLLERGDTWLGTFKHVNGEMIVLDGVCYQAKDDGRIVQSEDSAGVPFAVAGTVSDGKIIYMEDMKDIEAVLGSGECLLQKMDRIYIQLPNDAAFDTFYLKNASKYDIAKVEQGKG